MRAKDFIKHLKRQRFYKGQIAHTQHIPPRRARYGWLDRPLPRPLRDSLKRAGAEKLYNNEPLDKEAAVVILRELLGQAKRGRRA